MYCTWCGGHGAAQQPAVLQHKTQNGSSCQSTLGKFRDEEAAGGVQGAEEGSGVRLTCPNNQSRLFHSFVQPITAAHSSPREGEDAPPPNIYNNFFFFSSGVYPQTTPIFSLTGRLIFLKSHQEETIHRVTEFD